MDRFEIKSVTGAVLFAAEAETFREALVQAVKARADLARANLADANLARADLADANLADANLARANLADANLARADLADANLARADLAGANLAGAINVPANVYKTIVDDIRAVLDTVPAEVPQLLAKLWAGEVDGSVYEGACACLVGSIANIRGCDYKKIPGLAPDSSRPAERWFLAIRKGDTPVSNPSAAFAAAVIAQWQMERSKALRAPEEKRMSLLSDEQSALRFWAKVQKIDGGCWEWTGFCLRGYGIVRRGGRAIRAHRFAFELVSGEIPKSLVVCHRCDNPRCVRPDHLFVGTQIDNIADREQKGRGGAAMGERNAMAVTSQAVVLDAIRRVAAGERKVDVARRLGVSRTAIGLWCSGARRSGQHERAAPKKRARKRSAA